MGKFESPRENAEVEKAFRQVTNTAAPKPGSQPSPKNSAARKEAEKKRKIILISVCASVLVLLIVLIVVMIVLASGPKDDGCILNNVYAGNVDLSGMTLEEAKSALHLATDNTFSKTDMVVNLPDATITFSPTDTGAALDVDAVAEAAYSYGRTGSDDQQEQAREDAENTTYTIPLLPYLTLDLEFIQQTIDEFCGSYSSVMKEAEVTLEGVRPTYDPEHPDLTVEHQVLTIVMGTPDYTLDAGDVYDHVLDAYSLNQMTLQYEAPALTEPAVPDAGSIFTEFCLEAVNATIDSVTFEVTPEVYGYGFDVDEVQQMIDDADYGETLQIPLEFIIPDILASQLSGDMFKDVLGESTAGSTLASSKRNSNIAQSCQNLNDYVIKAGEEFSFNDAIGRLTTRNGYDTAPISEHNGTSSVMGGGVSQTASALYYCALLANLDIVERHSHEYAVDFIDLGMDAFVDGGNNDLRFRNNTGSPIRIQASSSTGTVTIRLLGVDTLNYDVKITSKVVTQYDPETTYQYVDKNNVLGQKDGDVLQEGITGYDVEVCMEKYDKESGELLSSLQVSTSQYAKMDQIVVRIESTEPVTQPTEDPTESTEPSENTDPTDSTAPSEETDPSEDTEPSEETDPTQSVEANAA